MVPRYSVILHSGVLEIFLTIRPDDRRKLLDFLGRLATDPGLVGDFTERDAAGRKNQVKVLGRWMITFWPDHPVKEVRIVRLERSDF